MANTQVLHANYSTMLEESARYLTVCISLPNGAQMLGSSRFIEIIVQMQIFC